MRRDLKNDTKYFFSVVCTNFLLTERAVITEKYLTVVLTVRKEPGGRCPYIKDPGLIFSSNDQADEVNNRFIVWLVLNKQNILSLLKTLHLYCLTKS